MQLSTLLTGLNLPTLSGSHPPADTTGATAADPEVTGITHNSGWVTPGMVFVAITGINTDGHQYIEAAIQAGAIAVAGERGPSEFTHLPVPYVQVANARHFLADAAAHLHAHPSQHLRVVGITGTDGKTTTSWLTRHLLRSAGIATGMLSTVGYELSDGKLRHFPAHFTTPEAPQVQEILGQMHAEGADAVVLETSSHALALGRVRAVEWDVAIWTNLTSEHLDFHGTVEQYFADKSELIKQSPFSVINLDDSYSGRLLELAQESVTYSASGNKNATWWAHDITETAQGLEFTVSSPQGQFAVSLPMFGLFNVENALAAMAAASHLGATVEQLQAGVASFPGVPGRMEQVATEPGDPRVIVDFAHTPGSLEKALATLRATTSMKLWVLIGSSGGQRDPSKRAPLGQVAVESADYAVFTEDDRRDTPIEEILAAMESGARRVDPAAQKFRSIPVREEAIEYIITQAGPEDTVLLAGKGPEREIARGTSWEPWDEVAQAQRALRLRS